MIVFGPVPSRRFGRSMGINNISPKICTYSCIYCQIGHTPHMEVERKEFYPSEKIYEEVMKKLAILERKGEEVDFLTFVPDGEPTLDANLGKEIELLKQTGIKIAVITNSSLLWREDVRNEVAEADAVSIKIDAVNGGTWKKMNRPHPLLKLSSILEGIKKFADIYEGMLITETMMVKGVNDGMEEMERIADFIASISPFKAYVAIPTRPPAEPWVMPPDEHVINEIYQIFTERMEKVEYLIGYEGNEFAFTGNVEEDLLSIMAVHPMREDAVKEFLKKADAEWNVVEELMKKGEVIETFYMGRKFYMRRIGKGE